MQIWVVTTDTDDGTQSQIHTSEQAANDQFARMVAASWETWGGGKEMPDDIKEAYSQLTSKAGFLDFISVEAFDISNHPEIKETRAALGQLLEQVYQMQGLFGDEDGAIARAVADAEEALK